MEKVKAAHGKVIVRVPKKMADWNLRGELYLPDMNNSSPRDLVEHYVTIYGNVVAAPPNEVYNGISQEVVIDDVVYFHYNSLLNDDNAFILNGEMHYKIDYQDIFCAVRDGKIFAMSGWVLVEADIVKPSGYDGNLEIPSDFQKEEKSETSGRVVAVSTPREEDEEFRLIPGDKIIFHPDAAFENRIERKDYYCMRRSDIFGYVEAE